jgi:hypothetical protein
VKPITQPQFDLIHNLRESKDLSAITDERQRTFLSDKANIQRLNIAQASKAIELLMSLPSKPSEDEAKVSQGRYFIVDPTTGEERFFKVDKPEPPSRWAGRTFVSVQASDDFYPVKDRERREAILAEIAKDPVNSMNEYGIRLGACGRCGRTLTNIDSRLRGLGPVCAGIIRQEYSIPLDVNTVTALLDNPENL